MTERARTKAVEIFKEHGGLMSTKEAIEAGIQYRTLYEMYGEGLLERVSRGRYRLAELPPIWNPDLAVVGLRIPKGAVCLISALAFHELTTQIPHWVYIALPRGAQEPRIEHPPIRFFRFSGQAYSEGVEVHEIDGIEVRIFNAPKTVADCFKFRNKTGQDVALEALKDYRRTRAFNVEELMKYARICRVEKVITPYLEAIL
jgi:predicted transcriptional regulator of viral defense system